MIKSGISKTTALKSIFKRYFILFLFKFPLKNKIPTKTVVAIQLEKPDNKNKIGKTGVFQSGILYAAPSKNPV